VTMRHHCSSVETELREKSLEKDRREASKDLNLLLGNHSEAITLQAIG